MRPRKKILLIDADETRRGILAYTLDVHRFEVHQCAAVSEARACLAAREVDLVLSQPTEEFETLWRSLVDTPWLSLVASPTTEDLLNQIKTLTARKRGPKKGTTHKNSFNKLTAA